ncbi:MAG: aminotransferase class I/II-fold pyridoxal phosphate-dependent enzyme [Alphaproteobacteria bacterium]|nr:aminotransferase class I/II-fold pyridoxal phosphate-dependent enzyme [Alphaproteobacteria bacterium]
MKRVTKKPKLATRLVRAGRLSSPFGETSEALFLNSAYSYGSAQEGEGRFDGSIEGFKYGRYSHPNLAMLQDRLVAMEEGAESCIVTASGMAAMFAILMSHLKTGDHVVANRVLFSSCHHIITQILPRFGITHTLVDSSDSAGWKQAITPKTKLVFIESPANPNLEITDIAAVAALCKKAGALLVVDNVFATPLLQHPLKLGADVVMYSTTKHIDGQGRTLGGAVLGKKQWIEGTLMPFVRHTGPHMSPFTAWVLTKALETLPLRISKHCENAQIIADTLVGHPKLASLTYPGLASHPQFSIAKKQMSHGGPIIALEIKGGKKAAFRFLNALSIFDISNNLGNSKSLATHPASTTHASLGAPERKKLGISDGLIRLSIGIEDAGDLLEDILAALKAV